MARRLLLDTSSLLYRAFFGLPTSIKAPDGMVVNAVHGYLDMTARLYASRQPDQLIHVYDDVFVPASRAAVYPPYKAHRPEDPPELPPQFGLLAEALAALGETTAHSEAWEADDAIGALCAGAAPEDGVEIVTGDRDLLQLVRDGRPAVRVLFTVKGVTDLATFDEAAVLARYGVPAGRYVDFAILRGDPSDGLPGVAGIGEKTAQKLVQAHADMAAILASAPTQPKRLSANLSAAGEYIALMQQIVPVRSDVRVDVSANAASETEIQRLSESRRLGGPIRRIQEARRQSPE
ncbi:MAG: flap endonuclease [Chloroflexi bacterium]|nr:flap endonuclease [Chloroflexota bacterium]